MTHPFDRAAALFVACLGIAFACHGLGDLVSKTLPCTCTCEGTR